MKRDFIFSLLLLSFVAFSCDKVTDFQNEDFHGFTFSPINHSKLKVEDGKLVVTKRGSDEEYGASFHVDDPNFLHFAVEGIPHGLDESFDVKILGEVNGTKREIQHFAYEGTANDSISYFKLYFDDDIVDSLSFSGQYLDSTVFAYTVAMSDLPGNFGIWLPIAVEIIKWVGDKICYQSREVTKTYDGQGNLISKEVTKAQWNWNAPVNVSIPQNSGVVLTAYVQYLSISAVYKSSFGEISLTEVQTRAMGGSSYKFNHVEAY